MQNQSAAFALLPYLTTQNPAEMISADVREVVFQEALTQDQIDLLTAYACELEESECAAGAAPDFSKPYGWKVAAILGHEISFLAPDILLRCVASPRFSETERQIVSAYANAQV